MTRVYSVVQGDNCDLIAEVAKVWIKPEDNVMDLTYGRGLWWTKYIPEPMYFDANDIDPATCCPWHEDYRCLPHNWTEAFDVVAFDPPYISTGTEAKSTTPDMYARYGLGQKKGYRSVFLDIARGMVEAERILVQGGRLLVKVMDYVESGAMRWGTQHVMDTAEVLQMQVLDEFIHFSGPGPQPLKNLDGSDRTQKHAHSAHSSLIVLGKR